MSRGIRQSGCGFPLNDEFVGVFCGYSDGGDRLRYLVVLSWPATTPSAARRYDPRYDTTAYPLPLVRLAAGTLSPVETEGHVYFFLGDELRTMRVTMNEHTDTIGLHNAGSLEGMWEYLQRFRTPNDTRQNNSPSAH